MDFNDSLSIGMDDFSDSENMKIPEVLPMMAVRDVVIFNYMIIPLFVGRPNSVEAVGEALKKDKLLMLVTQKDSTQDNPESEDLYSVGMVCMVMRTLKLPDGRLKVLVEKEGNWEHLYTLGCNDFYKMHRDSFRGRANRMVTTVLYLNPQWQASWGGQLVIYNEEASEKLATITPEMGKLVVFMSEQIPHEVLPTLEPRGSIAGWFRCNTSLNGNIDPPL